MPILLALPLGHLLFSTTLVPSTNDRDNFERERQRTRAEVLRDAPFRMVLCWLCLIQPRVFSIHGTIGHPIHNLQRSVWCHLVYILRHPPIGLGAGYSFHSALFRCGIRAGCHRQVGRSGNRFRVVAHGYEFLLHGDDADAVHPSACKFSNVKSARGC